MRKNEKGNADVTFFRRFNMGMRILRSTDDGIVPAFQHADEILVGANALISGDAGAACGVGAVTVRACGAGKSQLVGQLLRLLVHFGEITRVEDLDAVQLIQASQRLGADDPGGLTEGVCLVDQTARRVDDLGVGHGVGGLQLGMGGDQLGGDAVEQDLLAVAHMLLQAEEEVEILLAGVLQAVEVVLSIRIHEVLPGEATVNAGVAVIEMVGDHHACVALLDQGVDVGADVRAAAAAGGCVDVHFVFVEGGGHDGGTFLCLGAFIVTQWRKDVKRTMHNIST